MVTHIRTSLRDHRPITLDPEHDARDGAAVLVPVIQDEVTRLLLTERAGSLRSHGGEVAFPGGKRDETDASLEFTALRESQEEIGLKFSDVEIIGELRPFISKYGLLVTPFVGIVQPEIEYLPSQDEIASVFEVPLEFFLNAVPIRTDDITRHGESHQIPAYDFQGYEIWGLTSMIIAEFLRVVTPPSPL